MTSFISSHFKAGNLAMAETWQLLVSKEEEAKGQARSTARWPPTPPVVLIAAGIPGGEHAPILSTRFR